MPVSRRPTFLSEDVFSSTTFAFINILHFVYIVKSWHYHLISVYWKRQWFNGPWWNGITSVFGTDIWGSSPWGPANQCGGLAHLGERLICIQEVAGSIPVSSTRKHLVIKTVNKNNLYQYLYPNIKSYYLMFKIKIWSQHR